MADTSGRQRRIYESAIKTSVLSEYTATLLYTATIRQRLHMQSRQLVPTAGTDAVDIYIGRGVIVHDRVTNLQTLIRCESCCTAIWTGHRTPRPPPLLNGVVVVETA